jgi:hypothetical protein
MKIQRTHFKRAGLVTGVVMTTLGLAVVPASALATASTTAANQARLQLIINRGNSEISRRLTTLGTLSSKISATTKLSAGDESSLSAEVSAEVSGLQSLKAQLDGETTVSAAVTDAQGIINDYRVYALIVPKVDLVTTADSQQNTEAKLTALAPKLQTRITAAQGAGHSVTSLQSSLNDLNTKVSAAQTISSSIETSVVGLQPSDYNSDHTILSGDRNQLKTAQTDIQAAIGDAKSIITALKNL